MTKMLLVYYLLNTLQVRNNINTIPLQLEMKRACVLCMCAVSSFAILHACKWSHNTYTQYAAELLHFSLSLSVRFILCTSYRSNDCSPGASAFVSHAQSVAHRPILYADGFGVLSTNVLW